MDKQIHELDRIQQLTDDDLTLISVNGETLNISFGDIKLYMRDRIARTITEISYSARCSFGYLWGDFNGDGAVGNADLIALTNYVSGKGSGYAAAVDFNGDGSATNADLVTFTKLINLLGGGRHIIQTKIVFSDGTKHILWGVSDLPIDSVATNSGNGGNDSSGGSSGADGVGIVNISYTSTNSNGDKIYTILLSNGSTYDITCPRGPVGNTPTFTIGTVTTLAAGANATVTITGTAENPILNFGIPRGATGASGSGSSSSGADGVGIASVVQTTTSNSDGGTNIITVTLTDNRTYTFSVKNGSKGSAGTDGGYYTPSVNVQGLLSWTASKTGMPSVSSVNIKGPKGDTPVAGIDYYTDAEKTAFVDAVIAKLPKYNGGVS